MFKRIAQSFSLLGVLLLAIGFNPSVSQAELNQAYQNCLCRCGCTAANWNCAAVSCTFNTTDYTGSPNCEDASLGPCKCEGFGCGRAQTVTSGECYDACQVHLTAGTCNELADDYVKARDSYLEKLTLHQELSSFEYRVIGNIHTNAMKMGLSFVLENLKSPAGNIGNATADVVSDILSKKMAGETQDPIEVQTKLMSTYRYTEDKRAALRAEARVKMTEVQGVVNSMKKAKCQYDTTETLTILPEASLSDVADLTPRELKIKSLNRMGVINGYSDGTYQADKAINRAEFLKILVGSAYPDEVNEAADSDESKQNCFSDVASDWYAKYVCVAKSKGIVEGYKDGSFDPNKEINAVEALKIIMETLHPDSVVDVAGEWWQKYWDSAEDMDVVVDDIADQGTTINRGQMAEMIFNAMSEDIVTYELEVVDQLVEVDLDGLLELDGVSTDSSEGESDSDDSVDSSSDDDSTTDSTSDSSANSDSTDSSSGVSLPNTFSKEGDYTFKYPDGWVLDEANATHKILTKGNTEMSITESGYSFTEIKTLIMNAYMAFDTSEVLLDEEKYSTDLKRTIYSLVVSYDNDGTDYVGVKVVVPNNHETHNIWELKTPLSDFEAMTDVMSDVVDTWVME